jgi:hypothetical protein
LAATGSRLNVSGSMSASNVRAPARRMELTVAKKLKAVVITASPGTTPAASSASHKASVPEEQPMAWAPPHFSPAARSNSATEGPMMKLCEEKTSSTALRSKCRIAPYSRERSRIGTLSGEPSGLSLLSPTFVMLAPLSTHPFRPQHASKLLGFWSPQPFGPCPNSGRRVNFQ